MLKHAVPLLYSRQIQHSSIPGLFSQYDSDSTLSSLCGAANVIFAAHLASSKL